MSPNAATSACTPRPILDDRQCGLLLVGHGSRDDVGNDEFRATARLVASAARYSPLEACFLEFAEPTIGQAFENLASLGVSRIIIAPLLLFRAGHAERDIPDAVAAAAARHPNLVIDWADPLGCHPTIVELSKRRFEEALAGVEPLSADQTALVMVGRGSHSSAATAEMSRFVALRKDATPVVAAAACFVSMAEPTLQAGLKRAAESGACRIVVQPHLLFAGTLVDRIAREVERAAEQYPQAQWLCTAHLGPCEPLAHAVIERARAAVLR
jgi:sirohydrochlorin cobaltochelatase